MASYDMVAKLKSVMEIQTFSSGFTKREFVVTTDEQYANEIKFELVKEKTSLIDGFKEGQSLKVSFNIRGNEYNGRYYVNLNAWRIEADAENSGNPIPPPLNTMSEMPTAPASTNVEDISEGEDDLPF